MIHEMINNAERLGQSDNVNSLPELARLDRQAIGWIRIVFWGSLGLLLGLTWLCLVLIVLTFVWRVILPFALDMALFTPPAWWYSDQPTGIGYWLMLGEPDSFNPLKFGLLSMDSWLWVAIFLGAVFLVCASEKTRERLLDLEIWSESSRPPTSLWILLQEVRGLGWAAILLFVGGFAAISLMPLVHFGLIVVLLSVRARENWMVILSFASQNWPILAGCILILGLLGYWRRKQLKAHWARVVVVLIQGMGWLGLADLLWQTSVFGESAWLRLPLFFLMVLYPLGPAARLAGMVVPPFTVSRNMLVWIYQRIRLRLVLGKGIHHHRRRNALRTQKRIWATVCQNDLVRFETRTEALSYHRWISYGICPICQDDHHAYQGVDCIALVVDGNMTEAVLQRGPLLRLNAIKWLDAGDNAATPIFDVIVIGNADKHLIESLVVRYLNQHLTPRHRLLKQITVRLCQGITLDQNTLRMLNETCRTVQPGYDPGRAALPVQRSWEAHDVFQVHARRATRRFLRVGIVAGVIAGCFASAFFLNSDFHENVLDFWNMIGDGWLSLRRMLWF